MINEQRNPKTPNTKTIKPCFLLLRRYQIHHCFPNYFFLLGFWWKVGFRGFDGTSIPSKVKNMEEEVFKVGLMIR